MTQDREKAYSEFLYVFQEWKKVEDEIADNSWTSTLWNMFSSRKGRLEERRKAFQSNVSIAEVTLEYAKDELKKAKRQKDSASSAEWSQVASNATEFLKHFQVEDDDDESEGSEEEIDINLERSARKRRPPVKMNCETLGYVTTVNKEKESESHKPSPKKKRKSNENNVSVAAGSTTGGTTGPKICTLTQMYEHCGVEVLPEWKLVCDNLELFKVEQAYIDTRHKAWQSRIAVGQVGVRCGFSAHLPAVEVDASAVALPTAVKQMTKNYEKVVLKHWRAGLCPFDVTKALDAWDKHKNEFFEHNNKCHKAYGFKDVDYTADGGVGYGPRTVKTKSTPKKTPKK